MPPAARFGEGFRGMFAVLDCVSEPGSPERPNEDACGTAGDFAWVIDTSIFPGTPPLHHPESDATWFAGLANERFHALAPAATDGRELVRQVMRECREAFLDGAPPERHDLMTWPVGALTLVRAAGGLLEAWTLADTTAYLRPPGGPAAILGEGPDLREIEAATAADLLRTSGATPKTIFPTPEFRAWLAGRRETQRQGGGDPLFGLRPELSDRMLHQSAACPNGTFVILASDGFSALVDLYRLFDANGLFDAALDRGLAPLIGQARAIEREQDPDGMRFPRFKVSDDATALLLRAG